MLATMECTLVRVHVQFDRAGGRAADVAAWLQEHYEHLETRTWAQPGLVIMLALPDQYYDGIAGWRGRLMEATGPLDIALEIIEQACEELDLEPARVVSIHVTD